MAMYENIGDKIKGVAVITAILGIIASIIYGGSIIAATNRYGSGVGLGWMIIIIGSLLSWVSSFVLYGFGELIECSNRSNEQNELILESLNKLNQVSQNTHNEKEQGNSKRRERKSEREKIDINSSEVMKSDTKEKIYPLEKAHKIPYDSNRFKCSACGAIQLFSRTTCFKCERKFIED